MSDAYESAKDTLRHVSDLCVERDRLLDERAVLGVRLAAANVRLHQMEQAVVTLARVCSELVPLDTFAAFVPCDGVAVVARDMAQMVLPDVELPAELEVE